MIEKKEHAHSRTERLMRLWPVWAVLFSFLCFGIWDGFLSEYFIPRRWGVVERGSLYRSGQLTAPLAERGLRKNNIQLGKETESKLMTF